MEDREAERAGAVKLDAVTSRGGGGAQAQEAAKIADHLELGEETEQEGRVLDAEHKRSMT